MWLCILAFKSTTRRRWAGEGAEHPASCARGLTVLARGAWEGPSMWGLELPDSSDLSPQLWLSDSVLKRVSLSAEPWKAEASTVKWKLA